MDFKTQVAGPAGLAGVAADALLLLVAGDALPPQGLEAPIADLLNAALRDGDFALKPGQTLYAHRVTGVKATRLVVAHAGDGSARGLRKALGLALAYVKTGGAKSLAVALLGAPGGPALGADHAQAVVAAVTDAVYVYRATKPSAPPAPKLATVTLLVADKPAQNAVNAALRTARAVAAGTTLARECANRPANVCTPTYLAEQAQELAREFGLKVDVLDRKDCEKLGMGAFLAVAQGSAQPPRFIVLRYDGAGKKEAPVVLVGKGITFDTGGISMKPAAEMDEMKFDMGGAASVLGAMRALGEIKPRLNVVGLIPACENMPAGNAVKPGDVVTSLSGQTIEILNTDAEGRLILCDALTYAQRFLKPAAVVDIATLTGACIIALGHHRSGLFSTDDALAAELLAAGERAQDPAWRMPLDDEYDEALKSSFADMANVGPRAGGSITAAMFLKRYVGEMSWAHLDIAGTAWKSGPNKGATGRPVPLLVNFLLGRAA